MGDGGQSPWEMVRSALGRIDPDLGPAECHGILTGWLCGSGTLPPEQWQSHLLPDGTSGDLLVQEAASTLEGLRQAVVAQLSDPQLGFDPLLPSDDAALTERVAGLAQWCQGFLLGLSLGGIKDTAKLPPDSREVVQDMVQLSRAEGYDLEGGEEDEEAYSELHEYVRTAVLLLNEELHPIKAPPRLDPTVH